MLAFVYNIQPASPRVLFSDAVPSIAACIVVAIGFPVDSQYTKG